MENNDLWLRPPGIVGEVADYIYSRSHYPIREASLAGAIGMIAAIAGRAYNVNGAGLNQYIVMTASTGTGKEAIKRGVGALFNAVANTTPQCKTFIGPAHIASGPALIRHMSEGNNSILTIWGECGFFIQQMSAKKPDATMLGLKRTLLDIYVKSGNGDTLLPSIYSDTEKNTKEINSPALTIVGESTPERFFEGLNEGASEEGLLPRFLLIEYNGGVPEYSKHAHLSKPDNALIEKLSSLCAHACTLNSQDRAINVKLDQQADDLSDEFVEKTRTIRNTTKNKIEQQLYTRAHLKVLKLAALIAVGRNPFRPVVDANDFLWAMHVVEKDISSLLLRFDEGRIGTDNEESDQYHKVKDVIRDYIIFPWQKVENYAGAMAQDLHASKIVPYSYIQRRLAAVAVFKKDKFGSTAAIKRTIEMMKMKGEIEEVGKIQMIEHFGFSGAAYAVKCVKTFI